jgi:hypothetical protein
VNTTALFCASCFGLGLLVNLVVACSSDGEGCGCGPGPDRPKAIERLDVSNVSSDAEDPPMFAPGVDAGRFELEKDELRIRYEHEGFSYTVTYSVGDRVRYY